MSGLIEEIKKIPKLRKAGGCSLRQLKEAQEKLDLVFPDEYVEYAREFGCIEFGANEWTGLNVDGYLNTVAATKEEKSVNPDFPVGCFVLQDLCIDAKKVIVDEQGRVFLLQFDKKSHLCDSMEEYLKICLK